jgi:membrane fusion protein (multidrug efflux system)
MYYRIISLLLLTAIFSCEDRSENDAAGAPPVRTIPVNYIVASADTFRNQVVTTAEVLPYESVIVRAPLAGTVLNIYFEEGGAVKEGQLLIRLDDRAWKAQLKGLKVEYNSLQKELDRYKRLLDLDGASQQQVDAAVGQLASIQAQIDQLEVNIALANVKAPFSGQVGMRNFSLGSYMAQGEQITTLAQIDRLKVNFNLPEKYRPDVRTGETVGVKVEGDTFPATIYAIDPTINMESRTVQARAILDRTDPSLMPGVFAETILPTKVQENVIVLPSQVVVPEIEAQTVYIAVNGMATRREVIIEGRTKDQVLITSGINPGDTVLTTGLMQVKEGSPIEFRQNETKK